MKRWSVVSLFQMAVLSTTAFCTKFDNTTLDYPPLPPGFELPSGDISTMSLEIPTPGDGDGGTDWTNQPSSLMTPIDYGTNTFISQVSLQGDGVSITLSNAIPSSAYDILYTPDLQPGYYFRLCYRGATNQTSFYFSKPQTPMAFFIATSAQDTDSDGLTDGYEVLVTKTSPTNPDSDGNGTLDGAEDFDGDGLVNQDEFMLGTNPFKADSNGSGKSDGPLGGSSFLTDGIDNDHDGVIDNASEGLIQTGPNTFAGVPLIPGKFRGDNQVGFANQPLVLPFVVYLTNPDGTPVTNGVVTFSAAGPSGSDVSSLLSSTTDTTGNNGFQGQAQTFLTFGSATGIYHVTASYGGSAYTFAAETVSSVTLTNANDRFDADPYGVMCDVGTLIASVAGESMPVAHTLAVKLESPTNPNGLVVALTETAPGSGQYTGAFRTDSLQTSSGMQMMSLSTYGEPDGVVEHASADYAGESGSTFGDSDTFDSFMSIWSYSRGHARAPFTAGDIPMTSSFLKAAGYEFLVAKVGTVPVYTNSIENQADFLYISTHGLHDQNWLFLANEEQFSPGVIKNSWKRDLDIVIISGCSVLDVTGNKWPGNPYRPGKVWVDLGPKYFLGYEASAPGDSSGVPSQIVNSFSLSWEVNYDFGSPVQAWMNANGDAKAWNACALDCNHPKGQRIAWHWIKRYYMNVLEQVPESSW